MPRGFRSQVRRLREDVGDLLEAHREGAELRDFSRYADDPVAFIREVLDGEPWAAQEEIAEAVLDHPRVVVRSANGVGKDWTAARLSLWWTYARRGLVLVTGPTERQVVEVVMGEVARAFANAPDLPGELYQSALRLGREDETGILAFTSTEASRLTGFHAGRVMVVLTEAQGCPEFAWEGLLRCATGARDRALAVGNPNAPSGRFYTASRSEGWRDLQISAREHPNVVQGEEIIPGGPSREWIELQREEWGEGSARFQASVEGEFPETSDEGLFRRSWLEAAGERWEEGRGGEGELIVAVDPARFGPDSTVCAVRRGDRIERLVSWGRKDTMSTVERLVRELAELGVTPGDREGRRFASGRKRDRFTPTGRVVVDCVGLGAGVADRLNEKDYAVDEFKGSRSPKDGDRFANLRAEGYWRLRSRLEEGEVALPPDEELFDELLAINWSPTADGKVKIESKSDIRSRLGRSPDKADAVAMAVWPKASGRPGRPTVVHR